MKKKSIFLKLQENLSIILQGDYISLKDSNSISQFNINKIDIIEGTLIDYTNYIENLMCQIPEFIIIDHFSELALLKLNQK